jgi:hypothetical protein
MHRSRKHQSKKQRNGELGLDKDGREPFMTLQGLRSLSNILIEDGSSTLEQCTSILQEMNDKLGRNNQIVTCSHCAKKIGTKKCSGCPKESTLRYCSRDCQLAAWPTHKMCCGTRQEALPIQAQECPI